MHRTRRATTGPTPPAPRSRRSRKGAALVAAAAVATLVLAGCAPSHASGSSSGGTLAISVTADPTGNLNPYASNGEAAEQIRNAQLYEGLTKFNPQGKLVWNLATGMTPNADLTQWTIKLRPGVKFSDGSSFGANDVISSIRYIMDPHHEAQGAPYLTDIDPNSIVKVNDLTVRIGLLKPYGPFKELWANAYLYMAKAGSVPKHPIGTGPFVEKSFTPGQQSVLVRNDHYWGPKAKVQTIKMLEFQTPQAQVNALQGGQVNIVSNASATIAKSLEGKNGIKLLVDNSNYHLLISFNTSVAPFNDPRVIQALRLIVNRPQVVSNVLDGFGRVANDQEGGTPACPAPPTPQRKQDLAEAKKLLAEAGQSHLQFSITTNGGQPGMTQLVQVFAEDAAQAGVTVSLNQVSTPQLLGKWDQWPAYIDFNSGPYLQTVAGNLVPGGVGNATHWDNAKFVALAQKLFTTADPTEQCTLENEMHVIEYDGDGSIIPAFSDVVIPHASSVHGLVNDVNGQPLTFLSGVSVSG